MVWSHEFLDSLTLFQTSLEYYEQKDLQILLAQTIQKLENAHSDVDYNVKYLHFCVPDKF